MKKLVVITVCIAFLIWIISGILLLVGTGNPYPLVSAGIVTEPMRRIVDHYLKAPKGTRKSKNSPEPKSTEKGATDNQNGKPPKIEKKETENDTD